VFCKGQSAGFPSIVQAIIAGERVLPELLEIVMSRIRHPYPSDLSDAEWALLEPLLAASERRGRPPKWSARRVVDALFYLLRSGCAWRMLPRKYPPWQTVYHHFRRWCLDGRLRRAHDALWAEVRAREGRTRDPSAAVIDSQVVKTSRAGGPERGYDEAKRLAGRKRHFLVEINGFVLAARARRQPPGSGWRSTPAGGRLGTEAPPAGAVVADGAYTDRFREWAKEELGWRVEVPCHRDRQLWRYGLEEKPRGFRVLPRGWVVERTFAWLSQVRRLSKDYERLPEIAEAMIYGAMSRLMLRRLARAA
jgi:putative transposase